MFCDRRDSGATENCAGKRGKGGRKGGEEERDRDQRQRLGNILIEQVGTGPRILQELGEGKEYSRSRKKRWGRGEGGGGESRGGSSCSGRLGAVGQFDGGKPNGGASFAWWSPPKEAGAGLGVCYLADVGHNTVYCHDYSFLSDYELITGSIR